MSSKTHSELLFERYLRSLPLDFAYEPKVPGRTKRPDYKVMIGGKLCWFEVKEMDEPKLARTGGFDPTPPFEEKINAVRKQFREFKDDCCVLVLHGCKSIFRLPMTPEIVSAAFGERIRVEPQCGQTLADEPFDFQFRGNAMLRPDANTTISAIVILQHYQLEWRWVEAFYRIRKKVEIGLEVGPLAYAEEFEAMDDAEKKIEFEDSVRAVILENPYARIPLPQNGLPGPFDQRWGVNGSGWYTLVSIGTELERLRNRERPVPFLLL